MRTIFKEGDLISVSICPAPRLYLLTLWLWRPENALIGLAGAGLSHNHRMCFCSSAG